jgi:hypothetical protein
MNDKIVIVCPTFNRRKFLPYLIYQFAYQTYPKHLLTLIILDDSDISNQDIFNTINDIDLRQRIIYIYTKQRQPIGAKRNILNFIAKSIKPEYIICFDDDDYYPPTKVTNDIIILKNSNRLIGGLSTIFIYYPHLNQIYTYGIKKTYYTKLYYDGIATNGTLVYNIKYLDNNSYNNLDKYAEEKTFLSNYKIKICRFNINSYILISHSANTVEKLQFLKKGILLEKSLSNFINDTFLLNFYINLK